MAGAKEVKTKINSIQNTRKITKAMEMVAASQMRRSQERMAMARPYADKIRRIAAHVARASEGSRHPFVKGHEQVNRVGMIVVSTDRGMCGGLNINLFRHALDEIKAWQDQDVAVDLIMIGRKGQAFFRNIMKIQGQIADLGDRPQLQDVIGPVKILIDAYKKGDIDRVYVLGNEFVNTMTQKPYSQQLLPVNSDALEPLSSGNWDYIYEPAPEGLLEDVFKRFIEAQVYRSVVENIACEIAARRVAMKAASDNANDIIDELQLEYNKQRQAAITQELSEIVAGAAAVS